jgi:hypothetical protein
MPRVAEQAIPAAVSLALAETVLLPRAAAVVEAVAVELDREAFVGPAAVDSVGAGGLVRDR